MKKLADYINKQYISLEGLNESVVGKLSNLNGYAINECDCGCCDPYDYDYPCEEPYACEPACTTACSTPIAATVAQDPILTAKSKFYGTPKVYDLLDTHTLLDYKYRFISEYQRSLTEPVLFYDYVSYQYNDSDKLREDVLSLCKDFELLWPVLLIRSDGSIQLFAAKKFGSNGEECSIKSSLIDAADILGKLEKRKEVEWAQVLDVSIDNLDDLYDFLFTVTLNKDKYDKELEDKREKQLKANSTVLNTPSVKI